MEKKRVSIYNVKAGMKAAADIYSSSGQLLVPQDATITQELLDLMNRYAITFVTIYAASENSSAPTSVNTGEEESYRERIKNTEEFKHFQENFEKSLTEVNVSLSHIVNNANDIQPNELLTQTTSVLADTNTSMGVLDLVNNLRTYDDSTFAHSLNVSIICRILGKWVGLSEADVDTLTVAGLLHDLGKFLIPEEIVKKPGKLTDEEFATIKKHPYLGYKHVQSNMNIDERIKAAILMHHEKCDGTGYPSHLTGPNIAPFAKLVAIADVYDAMTASRIYREGMCPFHVIRMFEDEGYQKYEVAYLLPFLNNIVQTYINNRVRLSNGQVGEIVFINQTSLSRPIVNVNGTFIDLSSTRDLSIEAVL